MPETDNETVQSILERAVSMTLSLIGEKANKIAPEFRDKYPEIEWRRIIALRNRIVHSYDDLDFDIIYDIVARKLPELKEQLKNYLTASFTTP